MKVLVQAAIAARLGRAGGMTGGRTCTSMRRPQVELVRSAEYHRYDRRSRSGRDVRDAGGDTSDPRRGGRAADLGEYRDDRPVSDERRCGRDALGWGLLRGRADRHHTTDQSDGETAQRASSHRPSVGDGDHAPTGWRQVRVQQERFDPVPMRDPSHDPAGGRVDSQVLESGICEP